MPASLDNPYAPIEVITRQPGQPGTSRAIICADCAQSAYFQNATVDSYPASTRDASECEHCGRVLAADLDDVFVTISPEGRAALRAHHRDVSRAALNLVDALVSGDGMFAARAEAELRDLFALPPASHAWNDDEDEEDAE